jgi:hypothetical protein
MNIKKFKDTQEVKMYFMSEVLPKMENEDGLPADTLFNIWCENPLDYDPDTVIEVEEWNDTSESLNHDIKTCHE